MTGTYETSTRGRRAPADPSTSRARHVHRPRTAAGLVRTAWRRSAAVVAALALGACAPAASTLWQLSPAAAIRHGVYGGVGTVGDLRRHGNHGVGTAADMNGEILAIDGTFYRVDSAGVARKVGDGQRVTFGIMTRWRGGTPLGVAPGLRYCFACGAGTPAADTTFQTAMNVGLAERFGTVNRFYSLRLEGTFAAVETRSFAEQRPPFPCWATLVKNEPIQRFTNVTGTMVGFMEPGFVDGTSIAGYHLHFLTTDSAGVLRGGHVNSFTTKEAMEMRVAPLVSFELRVPSTVEYEEADLSAPCVAAAEGPGTRALAASRPGGERRPPAASGAGRRG